MMEILNNSDKQQSHNFLFQKEEINQKMKDKISDKFDLSIIGRIDLVEAEKIAQEDVLFLTEDELIEGLEELELLPVTQTVEEHTEDEKNIICEDQKTEIDEKTSLEFFSEKQEIQNRIISNIENKEHVIESLISDESDQFKQTEPEHEEFINETINKHEKLSCEKENLTSEIIESPESVDLKEIFISDEDSEISKELIKEPEISSEDLSEQDTSFEQNIIALIPSDKKIVENIESLKKTTLSQISYIDFSKRREQYLNSFHYLEPDLSFIENIFVSDVFENFLCDINDFTSSRNYLFNGKLFHQYDLLLFDIKFIEEKLFHNHLTEDVTLQNLDYDIIQDNRLNNNNINLKIKNSNLTGDNKQYITQYVIEEDESEINNYLNGSQYSEVFKNQEMLSLSETGLYEKYQDITDKVVIIEDKEMLKEFANKYPHENQNLIKLLSYLDGLFEKLPEEVIHKFVESEYFDLYSTLLQEMGD